MKILIRKAHGHIKRHYHRHYRTRYQERAHLVFLLDTVLVLTALALLGLALFFRFYYHPLRDDFRISLVTEQTITAGKETAFEVRVVNGGATNLHDALLNVRLPDQFIPARLPDAYDPATGDLRVGEMGADVSNAYAFSGTLLGPAQSTDLYVRFFARNDEGKFDEKITKGTLAWETNAIAADFELPETVVPGQSIAFGLHIKNGSTLTFDTASVTPKWPPGFTLQNATPPLYRGSVALGRLEAGEEVVVKFAGRFTGLLDPIGFDAAVNAVLNDAPVTIAATHKDIRMADLDLKVWAVFPEDAAAYAKPGQEIPVSVRYHNEGTGSIQNIALNIAPDANAIGGVRWETSPRIETLSPGESGERKAFVRVRDAISRYVMNPYLKIVPTATFSQTDPRIVGAQVGGIAIQTKIAGDARLRAVARYYTSEGDQLGRGSLPPRVGKATTYWIFASLETGATETQDGIVSFRLPNGVAWTGRAAVTAGQDLALEGDHLVWRIGTVGAHAGLLSEAPSASFEVSLTPSSEQVGTSPLLLSGAAYSGQDAWTGEPLVSAQNGITTQLPGDPGVAGRTQVKP